MDRDQFFAAIRRAPFGGKMNAGQTAGVTAILDEWDRRGLTDMRWLAYMLATAKHETCHTMQPIREKGGTSYLIRMYDPQGERPALARKNGNTKPGDGARFCGRGYVQLTWRNNYRAMGKLLGVDLEGNPDMAMEPDTAAAIMFEGMIRGSFTGKKLATYFDRSRSDWTNARRIINGTDRAAAIATIARQFYAALVTADVHDADAPAPDKPLVKSKIAATGGGLGLYGGSEAISGVNEAASQVATLRSNAEDIGILDYVMQLAATPKFWFGVAIVAAAGFVIYWRWRDHS
jgi:hypothetical protein